MTTNPACCRPDTNLHEVARMMVELDCGAIPVVEDDETRRLVGVITNRDLSCRAVAQGKNALTMMSADCLSSPVAIVTPDSSIEDDARMMEENQVRRVPVVDERDACWGMVAQADIATSASRQTTADVVKDVSQPTDTASRVSG